MKRYLFYWLVLFFVSCGKGQKNQPLPRNNDTSSTRILGEKYNYNIYIDNSLSMGGYVNGNTEFKDVLVRLSSDIVNNNLKKNLSLSFINDTICPQTSPTSTSAEIAFYIGSLSPGVLSSTNCKYVSSYIPNILEKLMRTNPQDVNILISDCVFSSEKGSSSIYLTSSREIVRTLFKNQIDSNGISTILFKFKSNFSGNYFSESNKQGTKTIPISNSTRPYYILINGPSNAINNFLSNINISETPEYVGFQNSFYLLTPNSNKPNSKILRNIKKNEGSYEIQGSATDLIVYKAEPFLDESTRASKLVLKVASNLSFIKADESYLNNPSNYEITKNFHIDNIQKVTDTSNIVTKGFDHIFTISTSKLDQSQTIQLKLKSKIPEWVINSSTLIDNNPIDNVQKDQTFGFNYLVEGISTAYNDVYEGKEQLSITLQISKGDNLDKNKKTSIPWGLLIVVTILLIVILVIKNHKYEFNK